MKRIILLAAFAIFAFTTAQSQEVRFGAKLGLNMASIGGDNLDYGYWSGTGFGNRTSFHIGGFVEIPLAGDFSLQPELLYSSEGAGYSVGLVSVGSDLKLDYIRVPILAKYNMPFVEGLSAELGPTIGVLISANDGEDVKDAFKTLDVQIGIGATYRFNFGLHAGIRYNKGVMNIYDVSDVPSGVSEPKAQSNVFQISAGYSF